ncbi:MAG: adenine deaminase [Sphingobacteriaceae bacterium]|jgi:adenine deaminase|nr:MAG: adenine deaminase [Pedobacter sp.]
MEHVISGNVVDVVNQEIFSGEITIKDGRIKHIIRRPVARDTYIIPGFVDAHIHIESSMLIPSEFARLAVVHGTVATVSDPHEIANVLGTSGVKYMIENGKKVPFKFYFGAPSCVPATKFETAGAEIGVTEIEELMQWSEIKYLAEMMNFPGVLFGDPEVVAKIAIAKKYHKPVDGHAPGLRGDDARRYIEAGISTDHECFTEGEALDKLQFGMKILIREGSAAKNFEALIPLMNTYPDQMMFCSDDKHPNELVLGYLNNIAARAVAKGISPMKVLRAMSYNPVKHYGLDLGLLQPNDPADFIEVNNLKEFRVLSTYINGELVAENGKSVIESISEKVLNHFDSKMISENDIQVLGNAGDKVRIIEALDGQLITHELIEELEVKEGALQSDVNRDILKLVVINRYRVAKPAIAFVKNFGLKQGAIASSVAHDSHNIIAVGVNDMEIVQAINLIIESKGGVSWSDLKDQLVLSLPVAGLMSTEDGYEVAKKYALLDEKSKKAGATLAAPYMTLAFLALLVIPELKLSDKGLFDGKRFGFTSLVV